MASKYSIRLAKEIDIQAIAMLESASFPDPWNEEQVRYEMKSNPCSKLYVAINEEDDVVGYLDFIITFDSASICRICVIEEYQNKGIASLLLEKMIEACKKQKDAVEWITLEVRKSNEKAIKLYKKLGWEKVLEKPKYYDDGEDAVYMMRSLL